MIHAQKLLESVGHLSPAVQDGLGELYMKLGELVGRISGPDDAPYPKLE